MTKIEPPFGSFRDMIASLPFSDFVQPPNRRATDAECLYEYLTTDNPVTRSVAFDIVVKRLMDS